ncbi:MAG: hypothetical protein ACXVAJ_05630 [Parachlamydiaceae bacterium]
MQEKDLEEIKSTVVNLMANTHNLEIALMASNSRLSLVEAFNNQLAESQIEMKEIISGMMHQINHLKASQNTLTSRLDELLNSQSGSGGNFSIPKKDITATLQKLRENL